METREKNPFLLMSLGIYLLVVIGVIGVRQWLVEPEWFMGLLLSFLVVAGLSLRYRQRLLSLLFLVLTIGGEMFFLFSPVLPFLPLTTVTLIPNEIEINSAFVETLATEKINNSLTDTTTIALPEQSFPESHARGWLLFENETSSPITLGPAIRMVGKSGITVGINAPITIGPWPIFVPGYATEPGPKGIIPRFALLEHILPGLFVENLPFQINSQPPDPRILERGQDEVPQLLQSVQKYLSLREAQGNEVALNHTCQSQVSRSQAIQNGTSVLTEQATASCTDLVYDSSEIRESAIALIQDQDISPPSPPGRCLTKIKVHLLNAAIINQGVNIHVSTEQWWAYQFSSNRLRQLKNLIAGKSEPVARALLLHQLGVSDVHFSSRANVPGDLRQIHIVAAIDHPS